MFSSMAAPFNCLEIRRFCCFCLIVCLACGAASRHRSKTSFKPESSALTLHLTCNQKDLPV